MPLQSLEAYIFIKVTLRIWDFDASRGCRELPEVQPHILYIQGLMRCMAMCDDCLVCIMGMNADDMSLHESQQDSVIGKLRIQGRRWRAQERSTSPSTMGRIEVRNRRRRYLEEHPEYFSSPSHELAGPI